MAAETHAAPPACPTLHTVAHAWRYSRLLALHLSGFILHPPATCRLVATVFHSPAADDPRTAEMVDHFRRMPLPNSVAFDFRELPRPRLCRRAIGRNLAAESSPGDWVLFSDVDYIFGPGALDAAAQSLAVACAAAPAICFPRSLLSSKSHCHGDAEIKRVTAPGVYSLDPAGYTPTRQPRAIGGSQWVPGWWARRRGYLRGHRRFQQPAEEWRRTFDDQAFRGWSGLPSIAIEVPNVFRVRHSKRGRVHTGVEL